MCKFKVVWLLALCGIAFAPVEKAAANPPQLYATAQKSPLQITLNWINPGGISGYSIYRTTSIGGNADGTGNWGSPIANLPGNATSFLDTNVVINVGYEYRVTALGTTNGDDYIYTGIELPLVENRGKLVLLVDDSFTQDLVFELDRLQKDLTGDGWTVLRHDVSRNDKPANTKAIIKSDYLSDPTNVTAVFLLGHIPIAYSGWIDPDDHGPRPGPTDTFYGDMTGLWTDTINYGDNSITNEPWWINIPGDGKYDQTTIPGRMDLQVGRVDFFNMTAFAPYGLYEGDLLRRYLNKDHDFRHGIFIVPNRGADMNSGQDDYCQKQFFGPSNPTSVSDYFSTFTNNAYLWLTKGGGGGNYDSSADIGDTADFAALPGTKVVFNSWFASAYWEWDVENAFLRAPLAAAGYNLVNLWSENPCYVLHHMALGKNIGYSARLTQNNSTFYNHHGYLDFNLYRRGIHMSLLGDLTLRMHVIAPPTNLLATSSGGLITLNWTASPASGLSGYHVYRASSPNGPFTRLNTSFVTSTTFTDTNPPTSPRVYMVQAVRVETASSSGTYFNASQGIFDEQGPSVLSVDALTANKVKVVFNKPVTAASSQTAANYSLNNGASINSATLQSDGHTVILGTSTQLDGTVYTLTLNNVVDQLTPPHLISGNTQASYLYSEIKEYSSDSDTISLWHLNGNGTDSSGNGATLSYGSAVTFAEFSPVGPGRLALHTTNTDSGGTIVATASIADSLVLPSARPFTFEARVYVNAWRAYGVTGKASILTLDQDYDSFFRLIQQGMWDLPAYGNSSANGVTLLSPSQFQALAPTGKWFHMAMVYDGVSSVTVYMNGRPVAGPVLAPPNVGRNGAWTVKMGNFDGYIDEVRLSKVARTFLASPAWLTATAISSSQINLAWTNIANNAAGFEIQRWSAGDSSALVITNTGTNSLNYNDTNLIAGTTYFYRIRAYQGTNRSDFSLQTSATTLPQVGTAPSIITQPISQSVVQGSNTTFSVVANGTAPLSYKWLFAGNDISGATSNALALANVQTNQAGVYSVVISNSFGTVTSDPANLTVIIPPSITSQPQGLAVAAGTNVVFSVLADGTSPLAYQWLLNGTNLPDATTSSYSLIGVQSADAGNYSVVVSNFGGTVTSSNALLTVNNPPLLDPVSNDTVPEGVLLTRTNVVTDPDALDLVSFSLGINAPSGAEINPTNGVFTWTPSEDQGPGVYEITVIATDNGNPVLTDSKTFTITVVEVNQPPVLMGVPNRTVHAGSLVSFSASASDNDLPANTLTFSLDTGAPDGATINATNGFFHWIPDDAQLGTNQITIRVTDDGIPSLSDAKPFSVIVVTKPLIQSIQSSEGAVTISWSAIAGQTYRMEYKTNLTDPEWISLVGDVVSQGTTASKTDSTLTQERRFYRVILIP
jgi:Immunoglobulin domain/Bacterial Ig domain/Fibronectin type III domain/Immunoglobulin I-set domain